MDLRRKWITKSDLWVMRTYFKKGWFWVSQILYWYSEALFGSMKLSVMKYSLSFCHFIYLSFCLLVGCSVLSCPFICLFVYLPQGFIRSSFWRFSAFLHEVRVSANSETGRTGSFKKYFALGFWGQKGPKLAQSEVFQASWTNFRVFFEFLYEITAR